MDTAGDAFTSHREQPHGAIADSPAGALTFANCLQVAQADTSVQHLRNCRPIGVAPFDHQFIWQRPRRLAMALRKSISLPIVPPAKLRRRQSLRDEQMSRSFSFTKRRVERQTSRLTPMQTMEQTLLDNVHVEFVKAVVPGQNKLASPRYVMRISNTALDQTWEMARTFKEFYELKEAIASVLDYGHFCPSNCPWLYMYAAHHFPRRRIFRSRSPSVISGRLSELQTYFSTLLRMAKQNRSLDCEVSSTKLPRLIYDFLFEGMVFDRSDFTRLSERLSMGGRDSSFLDNDPTQDPEECFICRKALVGDDTVSIVPAAPSSKRGASNVDNKVDKHVMAGLTTLDCGHCFHDECILAKLNESLTCPLCIAHSSPPQSSFLAVSLTN